MSVSSAPSRPFRGEARVLVCLVSALTLLLSLLVVAAGPADATTSSTVRTWIADHQRSVVDTVSEATTLAKRHNFVMGRANYLPFIDEMTAANPKITVAPYSNAISVGPHVAKTLLTSHPSWFLRDAAGRPLMDHDYGTYLINPADPGVVQWHVDAAKRAVAAGWTGIYLDCLGTYGLTAFAGTPIDPLTGTEFTTTTWLAATANLALAVKAAVAVPVIGNGMRDGGSYPITSVLVPSLDMGLFEGCFRPATAPLSTYPSASMWRAQVDALADMVAKGTKPLCMVKTWASGTDTERLSWRDFAVASFLIGAGSLDGFHFTRAETDTALGHNAFGHVKLGAPAAAPTFQSGAAVRKFTAGIVVVNPTGSNVTVSLGASYKTASGTWVSRVTVPPHGAQLLTTS